MTPRRIGGALVWAVCTLGSGAQAQPPACPLPAHLAELPLVELPAPVDRGASLAVLVSGDGGWASLIRAAGDALAARGVPVVGLNSLRYFWTRRTPEGASHDLEAIVRHYLDCWKKQRIVLVGYSLGADVLPFMVRRLPPDLLEQIEAIVLVGPARSVDFKFHVMSNWLGGAEPDTSLPVLPEIHALAGRNLTCIYGAEEQDSSCPALEPGLAKLVVLDGGHHFGGDRETAIRAILAAAGVAEPQVRAGGNR
ncbi:MAG TPA: AcvB/VirJ family lysyl-phosphatidylglycerol hydrolase [Candidatus Polarisedimenticolaceae bacterium]|nr:AcvB/VirJ family lysyl-phosphatidylglycerol hydrolase [Candidatus Polarisedimenticolaceae bacterium]